MKRLLPRYVRYLISLRYIRRRLRELNRRLDGIEDVFAQLLGDNDKVYSRYMEEFAVDGVYGLVVTCAICYEDAVEQINSQNFGAWMELLRLAEMQYAECEKQLFNDKK